MFKKGKLSRPILNNSQLENLTVELERVHVEVMESHEKCSKLEVYRWKKICFIFSYFCPYTVELSKTIGRKQGTRVRYQGVIKNHTSNKGKTFNHRFNRRSK